MLQACKKPSNHSYCHCRAQAELDGIQEEQTRMGELDFKKSPLQAAEMDRRKEKVAKLVKVICAMAMESLPCRV